MKSNFRFSYIILVTNVEANENLPELKLYAREGKNAPLQWCHPGTAGDKNQFYTSEIRLLQAPSHCQSCFSLISSGCRSSNVIKCRIHKRKVHCCSMEKEEEHWLPVEQVSGRGKKMPFAVPTPNKLFDPCSVVSALLKGRRSPLLKDQLKSLDYTRSAFVYYLHSWVICFCRASKSIHSDKAGAEVGICQTGI